MGKWLAAATVALIALLAILWLQLRGPAVVAVAAPAPKQVAAVAPTPAQEMAAAVAKLRADAPVQPGKLDPRSDAFFYKFDEAIPPALTASAAKCYEGGLHRVHRNAKVKLRYNIHIKDGTLWISDVRVTESTVNDKKLEDCFAREVAKVTWTDDELPDWTQDDELLIRPERGMKKFTAENLAYQGEGPIGRLDDAVDVASSRELPRN